MIVSSPLNSNFALYKLFNFALKSGKFVESCSILDTSCRASCMCRSGFFGQDCSLNIAAYNSATKSRELMCKILFDTRNSVEASISSYIDKTLAVTALLADISLINSNAYSNCV